MKKIKPSTSINTPVNFRLGVRVILAADQAMLASGEGLLASNWDWMNSQDMSDIFSDASYYTGWAATGFLLCSPFCAPVAGLLGAASLGFGGVSVGLGLYGQHLSSTNTMSVVNGAAVRRLDKLVVPLVPAPLKMPVRISLDVYDRLTSTAFKIASEN